MIAPYGTWASPLSAADVASGSVRLGVVALDGDDLYWLEGRPSEGGRIVLVRQRADGTIADVTPSGTNVRTRVHEYGGGSCVVSAGVVYYSEFADQRLYRLEPGAQPSPITPAGPWRYADSAIHPSGRWLVCVREDHSEPHREPVTTLVRVTLKDGAARTTDVGRVLSDPPESRVPKDPAYVDEHGAGADAGKIVASGFDFYSTPRFSPDGTKLSWLAWRHPQMPWDGTEVWVADVDEECRTRAPRRIAGGPEESIFQPGWSPDGELYFVADRSGWWNLYRVSPAGADAQDASTVDVEAVHPMNAEFGAPQWGFGMTCWAFADRTRLVVSYARAGIWRAATLDLESGALTPLHTELEPGPTILATPTQAVFVAGSPVAPDAVVRVNLASGDVATVRTASRPILAPGYVSEGRPIEFPTDGNQGAHAFYYPPRHPDATGPIDTLPPLIVISHGGPTAAATTRLTLDVQYWTSRGFAVVDVDYGGSSGYGRAYRQRLNGAWGVVDVADCVNAAKYLVKQGVVDPARLIIRGRSAGGYTTLAALTFRPEVFTAGASHFGICDLEVLGRDTHKFESRYLDTLIGPYPEMRELYRERSPIHHVDRLSCPLILLQGLEDKVVPPNQAQMMADAVRAKGLPVALLLFEGEQHGFRRTETIIRSLEAELAFYGAVFGFEPAGPLPPVPIDNLGEWVAREGRAG